MNTLNLKNINKHAPYGVRHRENNCYSFYFETDFGLKYTISFMLVLGSGPNRRFSRAGAVVGKLRK